MTLDELKALANNGDFNAIIELSKYYYGATAKENDIDEAIKWTEKGAKFGYVNCMYLVSILYTTKGHVLRKIVGGSSDITESIECLKKAMEWGRKAEAAGDKDAGKHLVDVTGELGISYFYYARGGEFYNPTRQESIDRYTVAINLLKSVYQKSEDPEVSMFLALSLNYCGELTGYTEENNKLELSLYHKCVDNFFGQVVHSDIASMYLGIMYLEGRGCAVNYDTSYYYFKKADDAGFDCSEILSKFKKKLFGGYTFKD